MKSSLVTKLNAFRADYTRVCGAPFRHFFCPILFRDEPTELCEGHILNQMFPGADRTSVPQRKDVDNFYGSVFEAEFDLTKYDPRISAAAVLSDRKLSASIKPRLLIDGKPISYFALAPGEPVPARFTPMEIRGAGTSASVVVKMSRADVLASASASWEIDTVKDLRLSVYVSTVKAAHLTLFHLLGYGFVHTAMGHFIGHDILGTLFQKARGLDHRGAIKEAHKQFREFRHMVRPVTTMSPSLRGSVTDRRFVVCHGSSGTPWGLIVFVKAAQMYAVLVPTAASTIDTYLSFLHSDEEVLLCGSMCTLDQSGGWTLESDRIDMRWPKSGILYPDE